MQSIMNICGFYKRTGREVWIETKSFISSVLSSLDFRNRIFNVENEYTKSVTDNEDRNDFEKNQKYHKEEIKSVSTENNIFWARKIHNFVILEYELFTGVKNRSIITIFIVMVSLLKCIMFL